MVRGSPFKVGAMWKPYRSYRGRRQAASRGPAWGVFARNMAWVDQAGVVFVYQVAQRTTFNWIVELLL